MMDPWIAWAAGIIDGEGCFRVARRFHNQRGRVYYYAELRVKMTSASAIAKLHDMFDAGTITTAPGWKERNTLWMWRVSARQLRPIIDQVRPYLIVKAAEADLLLQLMALGRGKGCRWTGPDVEHRATQEQLFQRCKTLKLVARQ